MLKHTNAKCLIAILDTAGPEMTAGGTTEATAEAEAVAEVATGTPTGVEAAIAVRKWNEAF